jgi:hypothetical protein
VTQISRAVGFVALVIVTFVGCGGDDDAAEPAATQPPAETTADTTTAPTSSPTAVPAACDLLTHEDAVQLAGTPLDPATPGDASCSYTGPVTGPTAQVEIYVGDGAKKFYDIDVDLQHVFTPVAGIGDEAYAEENAIFFNQGGTWVAIRLVLLNDPAQNVAPLEAAARAVADRM